MLKDMTESVTDAFVGLEFRKTTQTGRCVADPICT